MEIEKLIGELSEVNAPPGSEEAAAAYIMGYLGEYMDEVRRDVMGNVIGVRSSGKANAEKLILDAHMDEVGFIVTSIEEGYLKIAALGGIDPRVLPGTEIRLLTEPPVYGVVGSLPPHVQTTEEREKVIGIKELYVDVGMDEAEAKARIELGTAGVYESRYKEMGAGYVSGKALDNRACVAVVLEAVRKLRGVELDCDLYVMASVQEELGTRGAIPGAYGIGADYCIAVDVTHGETPDAPKTGVYKMGGGPAIGVGPNMNRGLTMRLTDSCKENGIEYQIEVMAGNSGTDAWPIQISREGVATAVISVPIRYMHSPVEVLKVTDAAAAAELLYYVVKDWGRER